MSSRRSPVTKKLPVPDERRIKELVRADIRRLEREQPGMANLLETYRGRFLVDRAAVNLWYSGGIVA
jgi:hypothetical protein